MSRRLRVERVGMRSRVTFFPRHEDVSWQCKKMINPNF